MLGPDLGQMKKSPRQRALLLDRESAGSRSVHRCQFDAGRAQCLG